MKLANIFVDTTNENPMRQIFEQFSVLPQANMTFDGREEKRVRMR